MDCEKVFVTYDGESDTYTIERFDKILPNKYNEAIFYQVNVNTREEVIEYINLYNIDNFTYYRDELGDLEHETLNTYFGIITKELYDKWQNYKSPYKDEDRTGDEYEAYFLDYQAEFFDATYPKLKKLVAVNEKVLIEERGISNEQNKESD